MLSCLVRTLLNRWRQSKQKVKMNGTNILKLLPIVHRIRAVTTCSCRQLNSLHTRTKASKIHSGNNSHRQLLSNSHIPSTAVTSWRSITMTIRPFSTSGGTPPPQEILTELSDADYEDVSEETLDSITEKFEDLADSNFTSDEFDVNFASGVITIKLGLGLGTYVINKQTPNKQVWLSSPVSGPKRYNYIEGTWIYKHDGEPLHNLLTREISEAFARPIDFTECSHGRKQL